MTTKLVIASDHAGFELKRALKESFDHIEWIDLGAHSLESVDYPDFGKALARAIIEGRAEKGVLICGTGIGISIAANRYPEIRAAVVSSSTEARLTRAHNDANVLCMGQRIVGTEVAKDCLQAFLMTPYEGGRHDKRVQMLGKAD